ncbi:hypothetical protein CcaverHIS002_0408700 [Cutaneotrichosporon cavernicola]|uniref:peptidyl-tRNA hydrolase n=1 Tax=Cutaneotrichosporon cavernicola TaxID=279322 RepID=A0AA48L4X0_9TREE|nr:uncharacterized protein CcaverHIS019_0408640 [Cutaneotrichosporon cavernicola]BEI84266.1 hypothetical protein CcaverHIS002_0408700 [Cutaneotrichosporon cavernicola]BEI92044.1 hypothetical protein CcaverHIS019_0408640 [Cutaneotrichosporon cavernicola]BEI99814.1 hypothetical protein CcaverHIS631_0408570 [Cutaneotrichosporon cavernicola]BEJ07590.1 hypothetical protein CcaverHIS641_0408590 [Cutaneotrichosporon cavernicola]
MRDQILASSFGPVPVTLAVAATAFAVGYQVRGYLSPVLHARKRESSVEGGSDSDSDAEDEAAANAANLGSVKAGADDVKLVLVVNDQLKMTKGKIGAQCGHATLACYETLLKSNPRLLSKWKMHGQPKIALRCANTEELDELARQARALNLCARTIQDAGRTQVAPGSKTVCGIGPGPARLINQVTGKLKLL